MRLAIMQPYIFPYIGYFQLMNAVDEFVVYDNIEFSKKGWVNRNRILANGKDLFITFPLKKDSDYLHICDRFLAEIWPLEKKKMLNKIIAAYKKSPNFSIVYPLIEACITFEENNLFKFIFNSLKLINDYLEIKTSFIISSTITIDHTLKAEEKVIAICEARSATDYINPIGGVQLYNKLNFAEKRINLHFIKTNDIVYQQFGDDFIPFLSIIDVMMFNSKETVKEYIQNCYSVS